MPADRSPRIGWRSSSWPPERSEKAVARRRHLSGSARSCPGSRSAASLSGFDTGCDDVAWAPLPGADLALVVGRGGKVYRARERRQLAALARIVDRRFREVIGQAHRYHPSVDVSNDLLGGELSEGDRS